MFDKVYVLFVEMGGGGGGGGGLHTIFVHSTACRDGGNTFTPECYRLELKSAHTFTWRQGPTAHTQCTRGEKPPAAPPQQERSRPPGVGGGVGPSQDMAAARLKLARAQWAGRGAPDPSAPLGASAFDPTSHADFGCGRWYAPSPRHLRSLLSAGVCV